MAKDCPRRVLTVGDDVVNGVAQLDRSRCFSVFTCYDVRTGYSLALPVEQKGVIQYALESLRNFTDTFGYDDFVMRRR